MQKFPIEKIFGSRTRVKIITLFTTGISRPYYVREISRAINERLNAVRRELGILENIGMLTSKTSKRRKYYSVLQDFILLDELSSIMQKSGPQIDDALFKDLDRLGDVRFAVATGSFTGAKESPTDLFLVGRIDEAKLVNFAQRIEKHLGHEISYTPVTEDEYKYRRDFNDIFLRQIFKEPYKILINKLENHLQPEQVDQETANIL